MSTFLIFYFTFFISSAKSSALQENTCINLDGSPANQFFIDQLNNAPDDSFIAEWKRTKPTLPQATTCVSCEKIEPQATPFSQSSIPLSAISSDVDVVEIKPRIKIEKNFFGSYFYRDTDGKKIRLTKQQAFDLMNEIQNQNATEKLNQQILESTTEKIKDALSKNTSKEIQNLSEQKKENYQALITPDPTPSLEPMCVERSLNRIRPGGSNKRACASDTGNGRNMMTVPCITKDISNYITWSINKAFNCINDPKDPMNLSLFFKKLNLESNFNFWAENPNTGRGIGQMTFTGIQEVMGYGYDPNNKRNFKYDGRKMLENILKNNPQCESYHKIANPNLGNGQSMFPRPYNSNICAFTSMNEGLQRNLLASIALYKFYRDEQKTYSSERVMTSLGIPKDNPDYSEMKNVLALMSYSKISPQNTKAIALMIKGSIKKDIRLSSFKKLLIEATNRYNEGRESNLQVPNYLRSLENKFNDIVDSGETLICTN